MASFEREPHEEQRPRVRLIPPVRRAKARPEQQDDEARVWAHKLHHKRRRLLLVLGGNALMLLVLVGGPFYRGRERALASFATHATFSSCLFGSPAQRPVGIAAARDEPERFAREAHKHDPSWPARCLPELARIAPERAIFVLPSVKSAEARVAEAARVLETELEVMKRFRPGMRLPARPLRALAQLRDALRAQGEVAGLSELPRHAVLAPLPRAAPAPAQLPVYVAQGAVVSLWGDDQTLHVVGIDRAGVSYLEVEPGHPLRRARLARPSSLSGFVHGSAHALLVWRTPETRCRERALGCHGKASGVALATMPLFALPSARYVGAHLAARPDRGLVLQAGRLHVVATTPGGQKAVESTWFDEHVSMDEHLPPLTTAASFAGEHADVLLVEAPGRVWALASDAGALSQLSAAGVRPLASFASGKVPWVTACARRDGLHYAASDGSSLVVGVARDDGARVWEPLALAIEGAIDEHDPRRDRLAVVCGEAGVSTIVRAADGSLSAVECTDERGACRVLPIAASASGFAVLPTSTGVLVAYSESADRPQQFVRRLELAQGALSAPVSPAACWEGGRGMCGAPLLAAVGNRIVLGASEGADLLLLESADEGTTWSTPPVY